MSVDLGTAHGSIELDAEGVGRGVNEAISALQKLEQRAEAAGAEVRKATERISDAGKKIGNDLARGADEASRGVEQVGKASSSASSDVEKMARASSEAGAAFDKLANAAAVIGGALAAGLGVAVKNASDLETAVARISTIAPEVDVSQVTTALTNMSTQVAQTSVQLAESLNNIFSSISVNQADALKLTEQFARGAVAAGTDAETFGTAIVGVMNAYGLSVDQASHLSDVFFNTLKVGVINGQQLATGLGQVTQSAKLAGVNFDELGALIAGVTREGGEASTNVNNLANALNKITTEDAQKGLKDLGIETKTANGDFRSFIDILADLKTKLASLSAGEQASVLQKIFPDAQARAGVATLISQLDTVRAALGENAQAAGVADAAYAKMGATAASQGAILKNTLVATLSQLGTIATPHLLGIANQIKAVADAFQAMPPGVQSVVVGLTETVAILALLSAGTIKAVGVVGDLAAGMRALAAGTTLANASMIKLVGSAALIAAPLAAVAGGFTVLYQQSIPETISSLLKYGDAWAKGRQQAEQAFASNKSNLDEVQKLIDQATAKLPTLQAQIDALYEAGGSPLNDPFRLRRLEAERENTEKYIQTLQKLKDEEQAVAEARRIRERAGLDANFIGPVLEVAGPGINPAEAKVLADLALQANNAEGAMLRLKAAGVQVAPTFAQVYAVVAQTGGAAGEAARETDTLSASYFANAEAARAQAQATQIAADQLEILTGMQTRLSDLAAQAQAVTTSVQPMQAAFELLNQKVAAGIPLTNEQAHLLATLPGYIAQATSGYDDLVLAQAQAQIAIQNAQQPAGAAGAGFTTLAGQAAQLQGALDNLRASAIQLEGAIGALGTENSKLGAEYNILNERVEALNEKKKTSAGLTKDEAAELATLQGALDTLGGQMGVNAAQQRDLILQLLGVQTQTKNTEGALTAVTNALGKVESPAQAGSVGLVGLTDGFGNVATAAGGAVRPVDLVAEAVKNLPSSKTVKVDIQVAGLADGGPAASALGQLNEFNPGENGGSVSQEIKVTADTSQATTALATIQATLTTINNTTADPNITATDTASAVAATVTTNIGNVPPAHDTNITATDNASQIINGVRDAINNLPTTFSITANVDTSGALSAIANLRANMPSSPADEGPFRTLPDWSSVYASLAPAGAEALRDTQQVMGALSTTMTDGIEQVGQAATDEATTMAEQVAGAVEATVGALAAIGTVQGVSGQQLTLFAAGLAGIIAALVEVSSQFAEDGIAAAKGLAESASGIVGLVVPAVAAFDALRKIVQPTADQLGVFAAGVSGLVRVILAASADLESDALDGAKVFAETASQIVGLVAPAVDAFKKLGSVTQPTADQLGVFLSGIGNLVLVIVQASRLVAGDAIPHASEFADLAAKSIGLILPAVEGFAALRRVVQPTADQLGVFLSGITNVALVVTQAASAVAADLPPHASEFADFANKSIGLILPAVEGFEKLKDITQPTADQLGVFLSGITNVALVVAQAAALFSTETLAHATNFADYSAKTLSLITQGVAGFAALAADDFRLPDEGRINAFAATVGLLARAIAQAASSMAEEAVQAAGVFSTEAGKTVALLGQGVEGFTALLDFTPPTEAAIAAFVATVINVVRRIADASKSIEAEAVKAAATFSEGAGKAVALIGAAINDLNITESLDKEGKPTRSTRLVTTQEIDGLVFLIGYVLGRLIELAGRFDTGALARMGNLADAAAKGLGALRGILDAINEAGQEKKPAEGDQSLTPAQAIDKLLGLFNEGLARLQVLATVVEQYKQVAFGIRNTMYEAMQAIGEAIGAMPFGTGIGAAQLALATNNGQFLIRAEVIHRHDPVEFRMMGENGPWIVRSLEIDGKSREEVAGMVGEILMGDGQPDQQAQP